VAAVTLRIRIERKARMFPLGAPARLIFEGFDLAVPLGEVLAIVGPSGIGKSSLLQVVAGLDRDVVGAVTGTPAPLGYLFQTPRLLPWRTALENVAIVLPGRMDEARDWLRRVGLEEAANLHPSRLSVGMARRVALARALAVGPKLLLLDEPFAALDLDTAQRMQALIREEVARLGATVLMVTHARHEAEALATRIIALDGAPVRIVGDWPVEARR
jgi:NitT/TauT family transport system ATP-binding protein